MTWLAGATSYTHPDHLQPCLHNLCHKEFLFPSYTRSDRSHSYSESQTVPPRTIPVPMHPTPEVSLWPLNRQRGKSINYPSTVLAKTRILPVKSCELFWVTLLDTPCLIKNCWVPVNIYFRSLAAWPDIETNVRIFVDLMTHPIKRLLTYILLQTLTIF
jgi:hypothetical protein